MELLQTPVSLSRLASFPCKRESSLFLCLDSRFRGSDELSLRVKAMDSAKTFIYCQPKSAKTAADAIAINAEHGMVRIHAQINRPAIPHLTA